MHFVGKLDREIYSSISDNIVTDDVIITDNQLEHIMERHPDAYQKVVYSLRDTLEDPDYIIEDKHQSTGLVIKKIKDHRDHTQMVLRICTSDDKPGYKNSIISCWEISEKRLENYLRNKRLLYKKE